jgi:hypothetical protein
MNISVFKSLYKSDDVPFEVDVLKVLARIKNGTSKDKILKIRKMNDCDEKKNLKNSLLSILFNGTFSARNDNSLIEHSGLCILDFDKYESIEKQNEERQKLMNCEFVFSVFESPSGNGLKALIRIPKCDKEMHKRYFKSFGEFIESDYFDFKNSNLSRVCFESYDPELYINEEAKVWEKLTEEEGHSVFERNPILPLTDEDEIIRRLLKWWDSKFGFKAGERNNNLFILANALCEYGINQDYAFNYVNANVVFGDFSENELLTLFKSAYKRATFNSKYFEDVNKIERIKSNLSKGISKKDIANLLKIDETIIDEVKEINDDDDFWNKFEDKKGNVTIKIDSLKYKYWLERKGFKKYYPESATNPTFVHIKSNKVTQSSVDIIKDVVLKFLLERNEIEVFNFCSKSAQLFSDYYLTMLESIDLKMIKDSRNEAFIPFQNGIVKITKNKVDLIDFIDVDGYIWENQIINRDFVESKDIDNDFKSMVAKVSADDQKRINALEHTLGYLIHSFKDKTDQKAIIINDQEIDDNPNGGSGKSLMISALSNFKKVVKIDGKSFDSKKGDFVYQRVTLDTQILAFDDVKKNFDFEQLFSIITEGIAINRKNKDEIFIPFERSPKIIITTNYVINGSGTSHDRRRHEIEFFQYFNGKRNPLTEYGRLLFDSWEIEDWIKFDNYMISNLKKFLKNGLVESVSINADIKRLIQSTNKDFYDWVIDGNLPENVRVYNTEIMAKFTNEYKSFGLMNSKTFLKWIHEYCKFNDYEIIKEKDHVGRYFQINTNNIEDEEVPF